MTLSEQLHLSEPHFSVLQVGLMGFCQHQKPASSNLSLPLSVLGCRPGRRASLGVTGSLERMSLPPCPPWKSTGSTYAILRLCALLKPAKEALRPTTPTAPVSLEDRKRTLTDMVVTYRERTGQSASHRRPVSASHGLTAFHRGPQDPYNSCRDGAAGSVPSFPMRKLSLREVREPACRSGRSETGSQVSVLGSGVLSA